MIRMNELVGENNMFNIIYMGQKPIGEMCFQKLIEMQGPKLKIGAVVTNKRKDNVWWENNAIYEYAVKEQVPFIDNDKKNFQKIIEIIKQKKINFIISVGHKYIISDEILALVNYQAVNLHLAKLPEYQGYYSYNHAILNREKEYGVTLHWMEKEVDAGDYLYMPVFPIEESDTAYSLYIKSLNKGSELFSKFLSRLAEGEKLPRLSMGSKKSFYDRHSLDGKRRIDDISDLKQIKYKSRAFYFPPFENAYIEIEGKKYYIIPE